MAKTWLVTGTSTGIGRDLVELLLARGDRVAATLRKPGPLDALKSQYGDRLWVGLADVTDISTLRKTVTDAFAAFDQIDVAISNAGFGLFGAAEECTDAQIERQIATNLTGSIRFARMVLPHFRSQGHGHLMQVSSMGGQVSFPILSIYHATKWGIEGFYESLAQEVAPFGIKITIVEPGSARTEWAGTSGDFALPMDAYESTLGPIRGFLKSSAAAASKGDPRKMARAVIDCAESGTAPLRLTLGSDAFGMVQQKLSERLAALEAQKGIALSTDFPS